VEAAGLGAVLIQDGPAGVLEDGVGERVLAVDLLADFGVEVIVGVLGLPVAAGQVVGVAQGAVGDDGPAAGLEPLLGDQRPADGGGGVGEESAERGFRRPLMGGAVGGVGRQGLVVRLEGGVSR